MSLKRRTPKEVIESVDKPHLEESWIKYPREEPKVSSLSRRYDEVESDRKKSLQIYKDTGRKVTGIHTHPYSPDVLERIEKNGVFLRMTPSAEDIFGFLLKEERKTDVIAVIDETGNLKGYTFLRKTKYTPKPEEIIGNKKQSLLSKMLESIGLIENVLPNNPEANKNFLQYRIAQQNMHMTRDPKVVIRKLKDVCLKYHLQYKFVPVKAEKVHEERTHHQGLETKHLVASVLCLALGIMLSTFSITGNVIGTSSKGFYSLAGILLFFAGLLILLIKKKR